MFDGIKLKKLQKKNFMSQSIQNTQTKNFEEIIKRREFLANLSASFLLAISLNPLMTLAYSPKVR